MFLLDYICLISLVTFQINTAKYNQQIKRDELPEVKTVLISTWMHQLL